MLRIVYEQNGHHALKGVLMVLVKMIRDTLNPGEEMQMAILSISFIFPAQRGKWRKGRGE